MTNREISLWIDAVSHAFVSTLQARPRMTDFSGDDDELDFYQEWYYALVEAEGDELELDQRRQDFRAIQHSTAKLVVLYAIILSTSFFSGYFLVKLCWGWMFR